MADFGARTNEVLKCIKYSLAKAEINAYNDDYRKFAEGKSKLLNILTLFGKVILIFTAAGALLYAFLSAVSAGKSALILHNFVPTLTVLFIAGLVLVYGSNIYENVVYKVNCSNDLKVLKKKAFAALFSAIEGIKNPDFQEKQADKTIDILANYGLVNPKNAICKLEDAFRFDYKNLPITVRQFTVDNSEHFYTSVSFKYPKPLKGLIQLVANKSNISGASVKGSHLEANDEDFNKNYKVFATDKQEAGLILAPDLVDWLKKHADHTPGIICVSGRIYIVLNNFGTGFELLLTEKTLESASVLAVNDFIKILDLIDSMRITEDTII